tara:strand:+ start:265 stop:381 length:117 start_codon:yes stop_codon:yes gene_type:complete
MGIKSRSGGMGKNELSENDIKHKYHLAFLCLAFVRVQL